MSLNTQKYAHNANEARGTAKVSYLRLKLWWIGMGLMALGETGNFLAYAYAPATVVAPLGAVSVISNCFLARFVLGEHHGKQAGGYLHKQQPHWPYRWQPRFFRWNGTRGLLQYYYSEDDAAEACALPRGALELGAVRQSSQDELGLVFEAAEGAETPRSVRARAPNAEVRDNWLRLLSNTAASAA